MTVIESFANWAVRERGAALGPEVRHHTRRAVIDWFAALLPGGIIAPASLARILMAKVKMGFAVNLCPSTPRACSGIKAAETWGNWLGRAGIDSRLSGA